MSEDKKTKEIKKEIALKTPEKILDLQLPTAEEVKKYLCPKADDSEIFMFLHSARALGLNPFKKEIYLIKYDEKGKAAIVTSYEVFIKKAQSNPNYGGMKSWLEYDGDGNILKAICEIYRKDWDKSKNPFHWEIDFKEYNTGYSLWKVKPKTMALKTVIGQAHRLAFAEETLGLPIIALSEEEMVESNGFEIKDTVIPGEHPKTEEKPKDKSGNGKRDWNLFWMTAKAKGFSDKILRQIAKTEYGIKESLTELSEDQYDELLGRMQKSVEQGELL